MQEKKAPTVKPYTGCSLLRRMGAIFYDSILLICLVFIAWQPVPLLPDSLDPLAGRIIRLTYLMMICFVFFGWFWTHGGQTLGMRAWRIKLVVADPNNNGPVSWRLAWQRFSFAILSWGVAGMGFIWSVFHQQKLAWHDIYSNTRLVVVPKN